MMKRFDVNGKSFIDKFGCEVQLRGINMVCKDREKGYLGGYTDADFERLKKLGFNLVRFGIFWDAAEPEPGVYNDDYLKEISKYSDLAGAHGIALYLDMHQDLFSADFCDGAPSWATLTDGQTYEKTELWSEAYLTSPAVQLAFDNFWSDTPASDGIGVQTHYVNLWKHIADYFKDDDNIIGYDVFNEPFPGTAANALVERLFYGIALHISTDHEATEEEVMMTWLDNERKAALLSDFADTESYRGFVRPLGEALEEFNTKMLSGFYQRIRDAVRSVDDEALLFIEANYFCNTGVLSAVIPPTDENGLQDAHLVYSPHGYDLMVDTDMYSSDCMARLDVIFDTHKEYADKYSLPVIVGEWGCYVDENEAQRKEAAYLLKKFSECGFGNTYFDYSILKDGSFLK